jgi:hypothetical protein
MQLSTLRAEGKLELNNIRWGAEEPVCRLPAVAPGEEEWLRGTGGAEASSVSFPYSFPKPGRYRLWVQVKLKGRIFTGVFDAQVAGA